MYNYLCQNILMYPIYIYRERERERERETYIYFIYIYIYNFLHSVKHSGYRMTIKLDKNPLPVEQNSYSSKTLNVYITYNLDAWPINTNNNFKFKNCLIGTTSVVKNIDKEKYVYSGYEITSDSAGSRSFDNVYTRNVVILGVDNSSSSHSDRAW